MMIYPTLELQNGKPVSLYRGRLEEPQIWHVNPIEKVREFAAAGAEWVHVTDFDGIEGSDTHTDLLIDIIRQAGVPIQLGGGIRTRADIDRWLEAGITRVILGTAALRNPDLVKAAAKDLPGQVVVGIDAKDGMVAVEGWAETSDMSAIELAKAFEGCGVAGIIATDIGRDGLKTGVNVGFTGSLADAVSLPIIASGGVKAVSDITALRNREGARAIAGSILGRALYDGDIDPAEAIAAAQ